jgi:predicted nucleic acid-binding protein
MFSATTAGRVPSKSIYDTSVYVNAIRSRTYYESILPHFARTLPTTYFCAVVAQELKAGCHTVAARERVEAFLRPFRRTGRLVAPRFADWEETGDLLACILTERSDLKDKLAHLINDTLIALCGVRLGAVVYTANEEDFALVRHYKRFRFEVL